jgi:hypothetical protein
VWWSVVENQTRNLPFDSTKGLCYTRETIAARGCRPLDLTGIILQFAYRLRRHIVSGWYLSRWLTLLGLVVVVATVFRSWPNPWPIAVAVGLFVAYVAILAWASRLGFVRFKPGLAPSDPFHETVPGPAPRVLERLPVRASGRFSVEGEVEYYVDLDADFQTAGTKEHMILARVHPSRFLLVGRWPKFELGWWYIFFLPEMIQSVALGYLHFGPQSRLALKVVYMPDEKTRETAYLTAEDPAVLRRIWDILQIAE